ncbi:MAG TPA: HD domain-containing protein [Elusimicrobiota bacterium]|nr:HD domain-containing protein [Elusimicrobiota bacterium]
MSAETAEIVSLLRDSFSEEESRRLWLVGGCVRDVFLGRPWRDVDLASTGNPLRAIRVLGNRLKVKPFPLDRERGVYRMVWKRPGGPITFDFSRAEGNEMDKDLRRRDFSVNAMAVPLSSAPAGAAGPALWSRVTLDPFGGLRDIKKKVVRLTGERVLLEDPLRLLRAFRFSATLGFQIDPSTMAAVRRRRTLIGRCAPERVRDELFKIFSSDRAAETWRRMDRAGLLKVLWPEGERLRRVAPAYYGKRGVLGHTLDALESFEELMTRLDEYFPKFSAPLKRHLEEDRSGFPRYALLKLTLLLHDVGKPESLSREGKKIHFYGHEVTGMNIARKIGARWRLSSAEIQSMSRMIQGHMRPGNLGHQPVLSDRAVFRFYRDLGSDAVDLLLVALGDHFTYLTSRQRARQKDPVFLTIKKLLETNFMRPGVVNPLRIIDGNELMKKLGLPEGPLIGRLLGAIRESQSSGRIKTPREALAFAQRYLAKHESEEA